MIRSDKYQFVSNFNVDTVNTAKTHLYSVKFRYVDTVDTCMLEIPIQGRCLQRSELIRSGWQIMQMSYLVNDWKY